MMIDGDDLSEEEEKNRDVLFLRKLGCNQGCEYTLPSSRDCLDPQQAVVWEIVPFPVSFGFLNPISCADNMGVQVFDVFTGLPTEIGGLKPFLDL
jgi:hypothetical protein